MSTNASYSEVNAALSDAVPDWVQTVTGVSARYGEFPKGTPAIEVVASGGDPLVTGYRSGGGIYAYAYEVYLKASGTTEAQRLDGIKVLGLLQSEIISHAFPPADVHFVAHEVTNAPHLYMEEAGKPSVWQMSAVLRYYIR